MKNCIQGNLIIAAVWTYFTGWVSSQSLAVSGIARIDENEGKSVLKFVQKVALSKNPAGSSRKALRALGWRGSALKNRGFLKKYLKG
jgi:hypothetical protein